MAQVFKNGSHGSSWAEIISSEAGYLTEHASWTPSIQGGSVKHARWKSFSCTGLGNLCHHRLWSRTSCFNIKAMQLQSGNENEGLLTCPAISSCISLETKIVLFQRLSILRWFLKVLCLEMVMENHLHVLLLCQLAERIYGRWRIVLILLPVCLFEHPIPLPHVCCSFRRKVHIKEEDIFISGDFLHHDFIKYFFVLCRDERTNIITKKG
jgi:hypothetical protein